MKHCYFAALLAGFLMVATAPASAQDYYGNIRLYPSPGSPECRIMEPEGGGLMNVYVEVHAIRDFCLGTAAFRVITGGGFTGTYVDMILNKGIVFEGNLLDGVTIGLIFGTTPFLLATIQYMTDGLSPPCSWLQVDRHPDYGKVLAVECGEAIEYDLYDGLKLTVNDNTFPPSCPTSWCWPVSTETSTWGRVKSLYTR